MGSACVAGQNLAGFEEAFLQACGLSCHLLWGDGQSLCCLMVTSSATRWGLWPRPICSSQALTMYCLQQDQLQ